VHWVLSDCDGILHLLEIFEDEKLVYLVLEYKSEGSLFNEIIKENKLSEDHVRIIME